LQPESVLVVGPRVILPSLGDSLLVERGLSNVFKKTL
jgi:hypothetical protein